MANGSTLRLEFGALPGGNQIVTFTSAFTAVEAIFVTKVLNAGGSQQETYIRSYTSSNFSAISNGGNLMWLAMGY